MEKKDRFGQRDHDRLQNDIDAPPQVAGVVQNDIYMAWQLRLEVKKGFVE